MTSLGSKIRKLISVSSPELCDGQPRLPKALLRRAGPTGHELVKLLREKNGFYAFESALHVLPSNCSTTLMNIEKWNEHELWRNEYGVVTKGYVFFAEDLFGVQFGLRDGRIYRFDPETGETEEVASSLDEWAGKILDNYDYETGYPLAHEWQERNGPLPSGERLLPKIPFVLGGEYKVDNLYALDMVEGMRHRADMWKQIKDLPEGAQVRLKVLK